MHIYSLTILVLIAFQDILHVKRRHTYVLLKYVSCHMVLVVTKKCEPSGLIFFFPYYRDLSFNSLTGDLPQTMSSLSGITTM